jgi:hypothetical protein
MLQPLLSSSVKRKSAQLVVSLLDRLAESALKAPRTYLRDDDYMRNLARAKNIPRDDMDQQLGFLGAPNLTDKERPAFSAFFNRRWFKRIWIIQELALAARIEVSWGSRKICWETLSDAIEYWQIANNIRAIWRTPDEIRKREKGAPMPHSYIIITLMNFASGGHGYGQSRLPFTAGLVDGHYLQSTVSVFSAIICAASPQYSGNPLDKVLALLEVVKKANRIRELAGCPITADYGKSALQVYKKPRCV